VQLLVNNNISLAISFRVSGCSHDSSSVSSLAAFARAGGRSDGGDVDSPSCFAFGGTTKYLSDFCEGEFSRWPQRGKPEHTCAQNVDVRGERATIQKTGEYHFAQVIEVGVADDL
jgi:hypothetical protein